MSNNSCFCAVFREWDLLRERKRCWKEFQIEIVSYLPNGIATVVGKVKAAIVDIYNILSDEIYQTGAHFGAIDEFFLPKAEAPLTIPYIFMR